MFVHGRRRFSVHVKVHNVEEAVRLAAKMGFKSSECSRADNLDPRAPLGEIGDFDNAG